MKWFAALLCLLPGLAWGQAAVRQTGSVTNNSPVMWAQDGIVRQAAGASGDVAGKMITGGLSVVGNLCAYSNTTDAASYNTLCLDPAGNVVLNGVNYPPTVGSGNVSGPGAATVNAIPLWNATAGTAIKNSAIDGYEASLTHPPNTIAGNVPGFNTTSGIGFRKATATATDGNNVLISRDAQFTGGTVGFTNSALNVECNAIAGITSNELCGLFRIANAGTLADGSMNVALYSQAVRLAGATGSTWAGTIEAIDRGNSGGATGPLLGLEIDVRANGADVSGNRGILQLVGTKDDTGGTTPTIQFALKIGVEAAFGIGATYQQGIVFTGGPYAVGIDMREPTSYGSAAIWLKDDTAILWDTAGGMKQYYNSAVDAMYFTDGTNQLRQAFFVTTGQANFTNGTNTLTLNPLSTGSVIGSSSAHDAVFVANDLEKMRVKSGGGVQIGVGTLVTAAGELGFAKITASGSAPGAAGAKEAWVCGTNAGTVKKIAYAGTSTTPVTIVDNVGGGVTGC